MRRIVIFRTGRHDDRALVTQLRASAMRLGAVVLEQPIDDNPEQAVTELPAEAVAVTIIAPGIPHPLALARRLAHHASDMRFLFAVDPAAEASCRREATWGAPPGGLWAMVRVDDPELVAQVEHLLTTAEQQRRLRATLGRMKLRLAPPAPVDLGEYRRLVASDRYLASVLRHAHDAIVSIDPAGRVVSWNQGADHLFGITMQQAQRVRLWELFRDQAVASEAIADALNGSFRSAGLEIERSGEIRFVEVNFGALRDDSSSAIGVVAIMRDTTERHRAEEELRASSAQKDEFLAMLAHELRNPLAPIKNAAHVLALLGLEDPRARHAADVIVRQAGHMTALIDDLLDVARVTRGTIVLERDLVRVEDIAREALEQVRALVEQKQQVLACESTAAGLHVRGDRKRLTQVLANLLINAAKYTPEGGHIQLLTRAVGGRVEWVVSDDGIGMEADLVARVFEPFVQAKRSPDRSQGGLGVGLALVRSLVAMHGGAVVAHSEGPGRGSTFTVRLPRATAVAGGHGEAGTGADRRKPDRLRIMVVDDNIDAAQTLGVLLREEGHQVAVQTDPRSALEEARLQLPEVMLVDIGMPHVDGYEFARRIRSMQVGRRLLLVALTGYGDAADKRRAEAAGFDHHLTKPLDADELRRLLVARPNA